jgi:hypothetical protein
MSTILIRNIFLCGEYLAKYKKYNFWFFALWYCICNVVGLYVQQMKIAPIVCAKLQKYKLENLDHYLSLLLLLSHNIFRCIFTHGSEVNLVSYIIRSRFSYIYRQRN